MAAAFKLKGNEAFKVGDYAAAIGAYTSAMMANPQDATFPLNRAAAYLKLSKFQDAESDCTTVLSLDPKNAKALFRRGQARAGLGSYPAAAADLDQVLALIPNDRTAKAELSKVQQAIAETQKRKVIPQDSSSSAPYRRRVPIEVIEGNTSDVTTLKVIQKDTKHFIEEKGPVIHVSNTEREAGVDQTPVTPSTVNEKRPLIEELASTSQTPVPTAFPKTFQQAKQEREAKVPRKVGGGIMKRDGSHSDAIFTAKTVIHESGVGSRGPQGPSSEVPTVVTPTNGSSIAAVAKRPLPANPFEFQRQWQSAIDSEARWAVLQTIPPETLPAFFKNSVEPPLLYSMFKSLQDVSQDPSNKGLVSAYLSHFKRIPRFETLALLFSDAEQSTVQELMRLVEGSRAG